MQKRYRTLRSPAAIERKFRVGIIAADTKSSWAKVSHVPAIKGLPDLKLAAVATRGPIRIAPSSK